MTTFRPATQTDFPALVELQRDFYQHEHYPFDADAALGSMRQLATDASLGCLLVIEDGGAIAGYLAIVFGFSLEFRGRDAFVDELYVAPGARGRGLGSAALRAAEEACVAAGVMTLHLEVERTNLRAKALYVRHGYSEHERHLMTKRLRAT